jgi:hypothetical protein
MNSSRPELGRRRIALQGGPDSLHLRIHLIEVVENVRGDEKEHQFCRFDGQQGLFFLKAGRKSTLAAEDNAQSGRLDFFPCKFDLRPRDLPPAPSTGAGTEEESISRLVAMLIPRRLSIGSARSSR